MELTVDTSWWIRYRSPQSGLRRDLPATDRDHQWPGHPARDIPDGSKRIQAIANTAAFHFGTIEQGGSSLYEAMSVKATDLTVLRIVTSIGRHGGLPLCDLERRCWQCPTGKGSGLVFPDIAAVSEGDPLRKIPDHAGAA